MVEMEGLGWQRLSAPMPASRVSPGLTQASLPPHRAYVFRAQSAEMKERGGNQTSGIDFFITQERIVFLDTQVPAGPAPLPALHRLLSQCNVESDSVPSGLAWGLCGPHAEFHPLQLCDLKLSSAPRPVLT